MIDQKELTTEEVVSKLMLTTMEPLEDRIIVFPDPIAKVTEGGILKPDQVIERERPARGTVIRVGPGKPDDTNVTNKLLLEILHGMEEIHGKDLDAFTKASDIVERLVIKVEPGDRILYGRFAGTEIVDEITKKEVLIMRPMDIFVKL